LTGFTILFEFALIMLYPRMRNIFF